MTSTSRAPRGGAAATYMVTYPPLMSLYLLVPSKVVNQVRTHTWGRDRRAGIARPVCKDGARTATP